MQNARQVFGKLTKKRGGKRKKGDVPPIILRDNHERCDYSLKCGEFKLIRSTRGKEQERKEEKKKTRPVSNERKILRPGCDACGRSTERAGVLPQSRLQLVKFRDRLVTTEWFLWRRRRLVVVPV